MFKQEDVGLFLNIPATYMEFDLFSDMLYDYICELHEIDENVKLRTKSELIQEYFYSADTDYYLFSADNIVIGFVITGHDSNCHSNADIYIEEFYIAPAYRKKGYGKAFAYKVIANANKVCFFELKKNTPAKRFWNKVFSEDAEHEWENMSVVYSNEEAVSTPKYLNWFFFQKNSSKNS